MELLLINSGNDEGISGNANAQSYPPLNIIALATYVQNYFGDKLKITLLDGQLDSCDDIISSIERIRPNIVGVSIYCTSIKNSIRIIQEAKNLGACTVLGNDHASFHAETILTQVQELDFISLKDIGEESLLGIVSFCMNRILKKEIPGVAYIEDYKIVKREYYKNPIFNTRDCLNHIPIPNRRLLDSRYWDFYLEKFKSQKHLTFDVNDVTGVTTINRARGCARKKNPCKYCGIADLSLRGSSGIIFWEDVQKAYEQVNANYFYESFDSATSWPRLLEEWVSSKPDNIDPKFFMYSQANETTNKTVDLFKRLGVKGVNTGFDSGDDFTLQLLKGSRDSVEQNKKSAALWTANEIEIHTSFVLTGLGDEKKTRMSMENTLNFAEWLLKNTLTMSLDTAVLYPDKSAMIGNWIWNPKVAHKEAIQNGWTFINFDKLEKMSNKWKNQIYIDPLEISSDFADVCGVDIKILMEYDREIQKLSEKYNINFGRSQSGPV